jgi:hypothetical protein
MADRPNTANPSFFRGILPRKGVASEAFGAIREKMSGLSLLKSTGIGAIAGVGIVAGKGLISWATGDYSLATSGLLDAGIITTGAGLGVVHAVTHGVLENGVEGAAEAIQHNIQCNKIENALCQNPELAQQAANRAAAYQFDRPVEPNPTAQAIIAETEQRRATGMNASLAAQAPSAPGARVI